MAGLRSIADLVTALRSKVDGLVGMVGVAARAGQPPRLIDRIEAERDDLVNVNHELLQRLEESDTRRDRSAGQNRRRRDRHLQVVR